MTAPEERTDALAAAGQVLQELVSYPEDEGLSAFLARIADMLEEGGWEKASNDVITLRAVAERARAARLYLARHRG